MLRFLAMLGFLAPVGIIVGALARKDGLIVIAAGVSALSASWLLSLLALRVEQLTLLSADQPETLPSKKRLRSSQPRGPMPVYRCPKCGPVVSDANEKEHGDNRKCARCGEWFIASAME